jgi:YHS domain-containing protein
MKRYLLFAVLVAALWAAMLPAAWAGEAKPAGLQTTCPVMGAKVDNKHFVDYQGNRVYFCCPGCPKEFLKNPDKYLKEMKDKGIKLEKTPNPQTKCPVMGDNLLGRTIYSDYKGKRIYFCCSGCVKEFNKNPEKYMKILKDEKVNLEDAPVK